MAQHVDTVRPSRGGPDLSSPSRLSRRTFIAGGVLGAGLVTSRGRAFAAEPAAAQPRIAIIGAGLAGLTCALRLHQTGLKSTVYEAHADRIGGRCWTARGFAASQTAEHGGEFIDTGHHRIRALAAELGLSLDDVKLPLRREHRLQRLQRRVFLAGAVRRPADVYAQLHLLTEQARADHERIGSWRWDRAGRAARELDETTALEWLDRVLPDGSDRLLKLATAQYISEEYGLDPDRLSAITMVWEFEPGGVASDERFHVRGGNDQLVHRIASRLPEGSLLRDHPLRALLRRGSSYRMLFEGQSREVSADVVVLCLPFTMLRRVDLTHAGLTARKKACIEKLGMGTNAKVLIQLERHVGHYDRFNGAYYDERIDTWDSSIAEPGRPGLLTVYSGGRTGAGYRAMQPHASAPEAIVHHTLAEISRAVTGLSDGYDGHSWLDHWTSDPWTRGSYAAFLPGQFTRYWGFVGRPEAGLHFAGEHTAMAAQGFMEGAVRSGERCAREVAARVSP